MDYYVIRDSNLNFFVRDDEFDKNLAQIFYNWADAFDKKLDLEEKGIDCGVHHFSILLKQED